jgi:UDP-GlcNAc:undecaprenyl-phosphate GlcNAc-1-phosphate transferase
VNPTSIVLPLAVGAALSLLTVPLARWFALRIGFVNHPNPIVAQHVRPVAYLGGPGIALAILIAVVALPFVKDAQAAKMLLPGVAFLILGIADDRKAFPAGPKFLFQALLALFAVLSGLVYPVTGLIVADRALSMSWILILVNAFNLVDVCDGLLAGLAAIFFAFCIVIAPAHAALAALVCGACLGFLFYNRPRATIFLGDAGSHFLGFMAAAISLTPGNTWTPRQYIPALGLALAVPLFETTFLVIVRSAHGMPWWRGSPDHFALRLQAAGLTAARTDLIAWGIAALLTAGALLFPTLEGNGKLGVVVAAAVAAAVSAWYLLKLGPARRTSPATNG